MSFNYYARKVRDPRLDMQIRRSALGSCILRLGWLTRQSFLATRRRYAAQFNPRAIPPREEDLLDALAALEKARNRFLERLRAFERRRIREKLRGRRRPRSSDIDALYALPGETTDVQIPS